MITVLDKSTYDKLKGVGYKGPNNVLMVKEWLTEMDIYIVIIPAPELLNDKPYFKKSIYYKNQQFDPNDETKPVGKPMFVGSKAAIEGEPCPVTANYAQATEYCIRQCVWALEP